MSELPLEAMIDGPALLNPPLAILEDPLSFCSLFLVADVPWYVLLFVAAVVLPPPLDYLLVRDSEDLSLLSLSL